jgi:hypothetical protein
VIARALLAVIPGQIWLHRGASSLPVLILASTFRAPSRAGGDTGTIRACETRHDRD